jgi:mRNA interferase RelE/StbE
VAAWRIDLPPHVAEVVRHLPPEIKRGVKGALRAVAGHPETGEPLRGDLEGLWKFRVRRYRIVYAIDRRARVIRVFAVGHRRGIYEAVADLVLTAKIARGTARRRPGSRGAGKLPDGA